MFLYPGMIKLTALTKLELGVKSHIKLVRLNKRGLLNIAIDHRAIN